VSCGGDEKNLQSSVFLNSFSLKTFIARTFDRLKLEEDAERVRIAYPFDNTAISTSFWRTSKDRSSLQDAAAFLFSLSEVRRQSMDITMTLNSEKSRLKEITFKGNKPILQYRFCSVRFSIKDCDPLRYRARSNGLENMRNGLL